MKPPRARCATIRKEKAIAASHYTLFLNKNSFFIFALQAADEQTLLTSEPFRDKDSALHKLNAVRSLSRRIGNFEIRTEGDGQSYFVLKNAKNQVIGQSEMYSDLQRLHEAMALAHAQARTAKLEELTDTG